jgi:hypothetical protein
VIITEKEAQSLVCHKTIPGMTNGNYVCCLGSGCMAWRWEFQEFEIAQTHHEWEGYLIPDDYLPPRPEGEGWQMENASINLVPLRKGSPIFWRRPWGDRRTGYCALAPLQFPETITT